MHIQTDIP